MANRKSLLAIFLIVFIGLLGFSIILPLLPYYATRFGASPFVTGLLVASYAAAQLVGAPLLGRLSDRYGRRPILIISAIGTAISLVMIGLAHNLALLFISRILDGLTGGNISVAQAYITDVTDAKNRSRGLGMIGAAFGLGFILGPAAGGFLSQFSFALPAFVAAGVTVVSILMIIFWLPESLTPEKRREMAAQAHYSRAPISLPDLFTALKRPRIGPLLHTRFFFAIAFSTFQSIFSLWALQHLGLDATSTGFILTYVGFLSVVVQGFLVGWLSARFGETYLIFLAVVIMAVGLVAWAVTPNVPVLLIAMIPIAGAGGLLNTIVNSALTRSAPPAEAGGLLGLSTSLESATRVISPSLGGLLLQSLGAWAPGVFSAVVMAWLSTFVLRNLLRPAHAEGENLRQAAPVTR
jgi:DHA1 family tetracycline resistance protein-like MFS transporter